MGVTKSNRLAKMSTNRGIFDSFPSQAGGRPDSPFAVVHEPAAEQAAAQSPFAAVARQESPFTVVDDAESPGAEFGKPVRLPERRKVDSPFQVAEPSEGFGFEAPARAVPASPFEVAPAAAPVSPFSVEAAPATVPASPFSVAPQAAPASPFAVAEPAKVASASTQAAIAAFTNWQEPAAAPASVPQAFAAPAAPASVVETPPAPPVQVPSAFAPPAPPAPVAQQAPAAASPAPAPAPAAPAPQVQTEDSYSDSSSIRQLELRAIFGVDREMSADEIIQRSRALPGMRNIARVGLQEMATIDALKTLLPNLGFGSGTLKLYSGSVPLEFIREGNVLLAVQTDGGFAPGVRETLMIVARELNRTA
jgi:hypothetical protein